MTQRKGIGLFSVDVFGKSAHSGARPELGINAIVELCHYILSVHELDDPASGISVNIGVINGGSRTNVVAECAHADVEVRALYPDTIEEIKRKFQNIARKPLKKGAKIQVKGEIVPPRSLRTKQVKDLFGIIHRVGAEMGLRLTDICTGGGSDANFASQYAPTIDSMGRSHNVEEEYILLNTLVERSILNG